VRPRALAVAGIKRALDASERNDLRAQMELESENQVRCFLSADAAEGMAAFFEKRAARFGPRQR
jgi:2-(1,2-epoxy-1,2-dihydrophenyl)acetyl-CoA isomerase